ncbi:DUF4359 domain-containing protein [Neobacillus sp. MER 74]|uniref:DUF4359 domain-containing protein n=1 Tax=Neobacillus sp. MER 74 TaxID=2939566 RepID=UPI00203E2BA6|nr:DUF4359 domain-containing protein [Neobacillus sp. MER 74]MCM3115345.1 DUF4359 domain-containing protein [Neobacillus sp. MER 74]
MKRIVPIIILIVLIYVLATTNPKRSAYIDWVNHKTMDKSSSLIEKGVLSLAGESIFDAGTTQKDYFIFTIYKTDFSEVGFGTVTSIGIFNRFITISSKE